MSLREAIKAKHDAAEAHPFTALLLSGGISAQKYGEFLYNMTVTYSALESRMRQLGTFDDTPEMFRAEIMAQDLEELDLDVVKIHQSTLKCLDRIEEVSDHDLMAYCYLYHMGDMYGGQMIKKNIPGSGKRFDFENRAALIAKIREHLTDDLADEANRAFGYTLELFDELVAQPDPFAA
jgi:heme oxygenase